MGVPVNGNLTFTFLRNWKRLASASSESSSNSSGNGAGGRGLDSPGAFFSLGSSIFWASVFAAGFGSILGSNCACGLGTRGGTGFGGATEAVGLIGVGDDEGI